MFNSNLNSKNLVLAVDLLEDLDNKAAETISGGYEVFTIENNTRYNVGLTIDGTSFKHGSGKTFVYTAYNGGTIKFDTDGRAGYRRYKSYNLSDGGTYTFQNNGYTVGNPYDFDLYNA